MNISAGKILKATPSMDDPYFKNAALLITGHNENGAMAFVINKPFPRTLNELAEYNYSNAFPLYEGGPVENEKLFFIHQRADLISGGTQISGDLYLGGDFKKAVMLINDGLINTDDLKLFIGYCGWDGGELEEEIKEVSWQIADAAIFF